LRALRSLILRHPPGHIQRATAYFLAQGHYDTQVARMTRAFRDRRAACVDALAAHGLAPARANTFGGSSMWMRAPDGLTGETLAARLRDRSVLIEPADAFHAGDVAGPNYRLAYSSIDVEDIAPGIRHIAEASLAS